MKITNRSDGIVTYNLPELNTRRTFERGASKDIEEVEANALYQMGGGAELIKDYLMIDDKEWVSKTLGDVPLEYFWTADDIKACVNGDLDGFLDALDFAPIGVVDIIKDFAWRLPITDRNKTDALLKKTGFDSITAEAVMKAKAPTDTPQKARRRKEQ